MFHFTDIQNAISIFTDGKLVCRAEGKLTTDIASSTVIGQTDQTWKNYVRLYFRPRTPTQYQNEGFRPITNLGSLHAHCPMPIVLLFDAEPILSDERTKFSDGNLAAANPRVGDDANFLESIPFEKVYHDSWLNESEKRSIIYHRHAEVIVPTELDLSTLRTIACRTEAELQTLRYLLTSNNRQKLIKHVKLGRNLFFRRWTFVEAAELEQQNVKLRFNSSSALPGPFTARVEVKDLDTNKTYDWKNDQYQAASDLTLRVPAFVVSTPYEIRFTLDGAIAFAGTYIPDVPF